jgi:hypothetical protein
MGPTFTTIAHECAIQALMAAFFFAQPSTGTTDLDALGSGKRPRGTPVGAWFNFTFLPCGGR